MVERFFDEVPRYDVLLHSESAIPSDEVRGIDGVERIVHQVFLPAQARTDDGEFIAIAGSLWDFSVADPTIRMIKGEWPTGAADQVLVNEGLSRALQVDVGDDFTVRNVGA